MPDLQALHDAAVTACREYHECPETAAPEEQRRLLEAWQAAEAAFTEVVSGGVVRQWTR